MKTHRSACRFPFAPRGALLAGAAVLCIAAAGTAYGQEPAHKSTPPERMQPEPAQPGGDQQRQNAEKNVQNVEKSPADRMAPASKIEKDGKTNGTGDSGSEGRDAKGNAGSTAGSTGSGGMPGSGASSGSGGSADQRR